MILSSPQRLTAFCVPIFLLLVLTLSALHQGSTPIQALKNTAQSASRLYKPSPTPTFQDAVYKLYDPIRHPITAANYTDSTGRVYGIAGNPSWSRPLGKEILIVDIDTRAPNNTNEIFNPDAKVDWESMGSLLSAATANHYLYSQIHGYDYKYFHAARMVDHSNTWIKPRVINDLLHEYRFVVFIDGDAIIQHLEVPLEWIFNRWGVTPDTSIAMPIDTKENRNGDETVSCDSKGKTVLNTGVVIAQALPHTFEMFKAWIECTTDIRYPGCSHWKDRWSNEQRAFSEYIRYDFNPNNNIIEIPCDEAMGYPGIIDYPNIISDCNGRFIRHHTLDKGRAKESTANVMAQSMTELMQKTLVKNKDELWVGEADEHEIYGKR